MKRCAGEAQTARGPGLFDDYGNSSRRIHPRGRAQDGRLVNAVQFTYPNVSQF